MDELHLSSRALSLKSDSAKKTWPRRTTYFNLDHSQSEALLEWNERVLDETTKFSIRDFVLKRECSRGSMTLDEDQGPPVKVKNHVAIEDVQLNNSNNNRGSQNQQGEQYQQGQQYPQSPQNQQGQQYPQGGQYQQSQQYPPGQQYQPGPQYQYAEQYPPNTSDGLNGPNNEDSELESGKKKNKRKTKFKGWESIKSRNHFISKVFAIVMILLIYNFGLMCLFMFVKPLGDFARRYWWMFIVFFVCFLPFNIVLSCCKSVSRKSPINYILLFFAATFLGLGMGCVSANYEIDWVLISVGVVILIVMFLTILAIFLPCDFTMLVGLVIVIAWSLFAFGILMIFFYNEVLHIVYCSIGILLFSIMIIIDIQMICGGKKYVYSEKDYALASLSLYTDVALLLMMTISIGGNG